MDFRVGERVYCRGKSATIKFIGEASFGGGIWYGIAFDKAHGKNDGAVLVCLFLVFSILFRVKDTLRVNQTTECLFAILS